MNIFSRTGGLKPGRSLFDLSHSKIFDCDAGQLIPILCEEMVPGDYFDISNECIVRLQPLVSPVLHAINIFVHYFFQPYRLLWDGWEDFITGGVQGTDVQVLPKWRPGIVGNVGAYINDTVAGSLWDYFCFPTGMTGAVNSPLSLPMAFPAQAYYNIYNEYYRDETLQTELPWQTFIAENIPNYGFIRNRDYRKDYFTSALPWQQRGIAPSFPISGTTQAVWSVEPGLVWPAADSGAAAAGMNRNSINNKPYTANDKANLELGAVKLADINNNTVDLSSALTFTMSDLRLGAQIQKFLERNARAGVRYTEFLQEHFGVHPKDERLQRPEYIGGSKQPLIISEVLKTSQDGSRPQGNLAGHGLSASMSKVARYHAKEFGLIMGIMSIMPEPMYNSQGFDRQWLRRSRYDFPFPEFAHLSEQAIEREEIFASDVDADNRDIWGFQGRFDEMRVKRSGTARNMRSSLNYWHLARNFASAPALNDPFLKVDGSSSDLKRIFAVTTEPGYVVHFGNIIKALRPIPALGEPGLIDHF